MKTKLLKINSEKDIETQTICAAKIIENDGLAAFPTETVWGIAVKAGPENIEKLNKIKNRPDGKFYALNVPDAQSVCKYVRRVPLRAEKLIKKAWPGPVTVVLKLRKTDIEKQKKMLGKELFDCLYQDNSIGLRCPANTIASKMLAGCTCPVVATSANPSGKPPAENIEDVLKYFDGKIDAAFDLPKKNELNTVDCRDTKTSTVVMFDGFKVDILRQGAVSQDKIREICSVQILFVCTGNTCRSPMAEFFCKKYLSEKLNCNIDELEKIGYKVISAGVMTSNGLSPTPEAVEVCRSKGVDISQSTSSVMTSEMAQSSDLILTAGTAHRDTIISQWPEEAEKTFLLDFPAEIDDPIGRSLAFYENCALQIEKAVLKRTDEVLL